MLNFFLSCFKLLLRHLNYFKSLFLDKLFSLSYVINNFIIRNIILILDLLPIFTSFFIGVILNYQSLQKVMEISFFEYLFSIFFLYLVLGIILFSIIFFLIYLCRYLNINERYIDAFILVLVVLFLIYNSYSLASNTAYADEIRYLKKGQFPSWMLNLNIDEGGNGSPGIKDKRSIIGVKPPIIAADVPTSVTGHEDLRPNITKAPVLTIEFLNNKGILERLHLTQENLEYIRNFWVSHLKNAINSNDLPTQAIYLEKSGLSKTFLTAISINTIKDGNTLDKTSTLITEAYLKIFSVATDSEKYNILFPNQALAEIQIVFLSDESLKYDLLKEMISLKDKGICNLTEVMDIIREEDLDENKVKIKVKSFFLLRENELYFFSSQDKNFFKLLSSFSDVQTNNLKGAFGNSSSGKLFLSDKIRFDKNFNIVDLTEWKSTSTEDLVPFIEDKGGRYQGTPVEIWVYDKSRYQGDPSVEEAAKRYTNVQLRSAQEVHLKANNQVIRFNAIMNPHTYNHYYAKHSHENLMCMSGLKVIKLIAK